MFDSKHYVPILKWKRAEQNALQALTTESKEHMTPVIQFVMPKLTAKEAAGKNEDEQFKELILKFQKKTKELPQEILEAWGVTPVFVDVSLLYTTELKIEALNTILLIAKANEMILIPVLHLSDEAQIITAIKQNSSAICLRLVCADLDDLSTLDQKLKDFLLLTGLEEKDIDLLVDIKEIAEDPHKFSKYIDLSNKIPNLLKWRTFIFSSGAFHEDLSKCKIDEETLIPRHEWVNWTPLFKDKELIRIPCFGDYTIQYPIYKESTQFFAPTTSIKYTLDNEWLILKGKKQEYGLYLANAKLLVGDSRFYGEGFSDGDKFISEKAKHYDEYIKDPSIKGTGSTENWLTAGINHHLVLTALQVSKLP